jgi:hypothetical protein
MGDLTFEELKALHDSGKMGPEEVAALSPQERKVYESFEGSTVDKLQKGADRFMYPQEGDKNFNRSMNVPGWVPPAAQAAGLVATGGVGMGASGIKSAASAAKPFAVGGAGLFALEKARQAGLIGPQLASAIEAAMGFKMMMGGGAKGAAGAGSAAELETLEQQLAKQGINPKNAGMAARGEKFPPPLTNGSQGGPMKPSLADDETLMEQTGRGVQNDFKGPATIVKQRPYEDINLRDAYPRNIKTESNSDDLLELLTGSSHNRGEGPTPMQFNDKDLRNTLDRINRLKRRDQ